MNTKRGVKRCGTLLLYGSAPLLNAAEEISQKSVLDLYKEGGPVMHLVAFCSIAAVALAVYCGVSFRKRRLMQPTVVANLNDLLSNRNLQQAYINIQYFCSV